MCLIQALRNSSPCWEETFPSPTESRWPLVAAEATASIQPTVLGWVGDRDQLLVSGFQLNLYV